MQISSGPIGSLNPDNKNVTIIGAGISGLLIAYYLKKNGFIVSLYEKEKKVGGKISTIETEYGLAETAANAIFTNEDVLELLNELNLNIIAATKNLKKHVWYNGAPKSSPLNFLQILRITLGLFKKIEKKDLNQKSIYDFFSPFTGKFFASQIMSAALGGVYAENTKNLHFQSIFKSPIKSNRYIGFVLELIKKKKSSSGHKAHSVCFQGGMQTFVNALENELKENIIYQEKCLEDENTIICTDAHNAAKLFEKKDSQISTLLSEINYNQLDSTTVFTKSPIHFLNESFGVVFTPKENFSTLGVVHNTAIFPDRVKTKESYSYTFMTRTNEKVEDVIDKEINLIAGEKFHHEIIFKQVTPWQKAIPIYNLKRFENILKIRTKMNNFNKGTVIFGNYVDGISIREMVTAAKKFAEDFKNE